MSRKSSSLAKYIDHTFLKPAGEKDAVRKLCREATRIGTSAGSKLLA